MPNPNPIEIFEHELDAYELTAQQYRMSQNPQRIIQVLIAKGIIARCKANLVTLDQAKALLFALKESMPFEYTTYLGQGSKLKKLLTKFTATADTPTPYFKATIPKAITFTPTTSLGLSPTQIAATAYLQKLAQIKLKTDASNTDAFAILPETYHDLMTDTELDVAHLAKSTDITLRFDVSQIDDTASDAFLPEFKTIPLGLLHHAKALYDLVAENLPEEQKLAAKKHILARLPPQVVKDFENFLAKTITFDSEEIKTDREFAHEYMDERLTSSSPRLLEAAVAQQKIKKAQLANILTAIFALTAQFHSESAKAIVSDKTYTSFENLMGYLVAIASVIDLKLYPELKRDRAKLIAEYTYMRQQGSEVVAQILDILLKNGYLISAELNSPIDAIALLKRLYQEPNTPMKRKIFQQLNQKHHGTSLLEKLSSNATTAARIKNEAIALTMTSLNICKSQEATRRSTDELDSLLHERIINAASNHFHTLLLKNARKIYLKYWNQAQKTYGADHPEAETRLWVEWQTLSEAIPDGIAEFDLIWGDIFDISSLPTTPISTHLARDEGCPTVTYQLEPKHLTLRLMRPLTLTQINSLLVSTNAEVRRSLLTEFTRSIIIEGIEIAKFDERLMTTATEAPAAIKYKLDCSLNLSARDPTDTSISSPHSEEAYDALFTQVIELNQIFKDILNIITASNASLHTFARNIDAAHANAHEGVLLLASAHQTDIKAIRDIIALQDKAIATGRVAGNPLQNDKVSEALKALKLEEVFHSSLPKARKNAAAKKALITLLIEAIEDCYRRYGGTDPYRRNAAQIALIKKFKGIAEIVFIDNTPKIKFNAELFKLSINDCYNTLIKLLNSNRGSLSLFTFWVDCTTVQFIKHKLQRQGLKDSEHGELYHLEHDDLIATPSTAVSTLATPATTHEETSMTSPSTPIPISLATTTPANEEYPTQTLTETLGITLPDRISKAVTEQVSTTITWIRESIMGSPTRKPKGAGGAGSPPRSPG